MIIIGYPGVGKSTLAESYVNGDRPNGFKSVIDLESSLFHGGCTGDPFRGGREVTNWAYTYCSVAMELSRQGHIVFVSSHADVQRYLRECTEQVRVVYPAIELKQEWLERLRGRYICSWDNEKDKNFAAYNRACDHYEDDIEYLKSNGFELMEITEMHYDLADLVFGEQEAE